MLDAPDPAAAIFAANRAKAGARLAYGPGEPASRLIDLAEWGGYRVKFPAVQTRAEAVLLNTGGGMAGGDALAVSIALEAGAALTFTTQSAERVYRSQGPAATITLDVKLGEGADLAFIPQETILFDRARLARCRTSEHDGFGQQQRAAFGHIRRNRAGERITDGSLRDRWRIRRGGALVYADDVRLDGAMSDHLQRAAIAAGAGAVGALLLVAPGAADRLEETRALLSGAPCRAAASTWNGLLSVRAAGNPGDVRKVFAGLISGLSRRALPRVWLGG